MAITYILSAVILLGVCIFIHELGHLLGGIIVGVKARTFSLGYGPGFIKKKWGDTTYQITLIPFGGYCAFYGDNPSEKLKGESWEFFSVHPLKRIIIVVMGPLFNLFLAVLLFFIMNLAGYEIMSSRIYFPEVIKSGQIASPAYQSGMTDGDVITAINGKKIASYEDIQATVSLSDGSPLEIEIMRDGTRRVFTVVPEKNDETGYFLIGVYPFGDKVLIADTVKGDVADKAGLMKFDVVDTVNGIRVITAEQFVNLIRVQAGKETVLGVIRKGKRFSITVVPRKKERLTLNNLTDMRFKDRRVGTIVVDDIDRIKKAIDNGNIRVNGEIAVSIEDFADKSSGEGSLIELAGAEYRASVSYEQFGQIGVYPAISPDMVPVKYSIGKAFIQSIVEPFDFLYINLKGLGKLVTGKLNVRKNLSGPVRIAVLAGDTMAYLGIREFIILMARISVILMMMNLLPIPAVDGSHILIYLVEAVRKKKMSIELLERIQMIGILIMITLGIFVIMNDITQVFFQ